MSEVRRFVDRDGVAWTIKWKGGEIAMDVSADFDDTGLELPPGGLHFRSVDFAFFVQMSEVEPDDLLPEELQRMIDDANR